MRRRAICRTPTGVLAALALLLIASSALPDGTTQAVRPSASFPPGDLARGKLIAETCTTCHGDVEIMAGDPPIRPPRLFHQRASATFFALQAYRSGDRESEVMKPLAAALDDQQMRDIAAYLASEPLGPPVAQMASSQAHAFAISRCGLCHGETGMGEMEGVPILTGQDKDYLKRALVDYKEGRRADVTMRAVASEMSETEMNEVALYYSSQHALERIP